MIKRCLIGALVAALSFAWRTGCRKSSVAHRPPQAGAQAQSPPTGRAQVSSRPGYAPNMLPCRGSEDGLRAYAAAIMRTDKGERTAPDRSSVGWSSDGKALIVYVSPIHEGPDKYPNARVYSVPLASLPESPIGQVD